VVVVVVVAGETTSAPGIGIVCAVY